MTTIKTHSQCQSCGMPMKMDKMGGGTEKDGSLSEKYCSSCYEKGAFIHPNMTVKEMQELVENVLKNEMKWLFPLRWLAVRQIPGLDRWKKQ